jgi:hypothetical protein
VHGISGDGHCLRRRPQDLTAGVWSACRIPREIGPTEVSACSESTLLSRLSFLLECNHVHEISNCYNVICSRRLLEISCWRLSSWGLSLAAGINDAATFPDYHIYVSNQSGNTVLLAVRALGLGGELFDLRGVGFSLGFYILGGWVLGQLGNRWGRNRRAWLSAANIVQTLFVFTAAACASGWLSSTVSDRRGASSRY